MCKSDGLAHNSREYVCYGNVSEFTKCDFRGTHSDIVRYRFNVSKNAPKYLKAFAFADDYPKDKVCSVVWDNLFLRPPPQSMAVCAAGCGGRQRLL